jgi:hypothetical protein
MEKTVSGRGELNATRRRKPLSTAPIAALALFSLCVFILWPRPKHLITTEMFDRIKFGMSRAEVEAILGHPGDYATGPLEVDDKSAKPFIVGFVPLADSYELDDMVQVQWVCDIGTVDVFFEDPGGAQCSCFFPFRKMKLSPLDNLIWRANRYWRNSYPKK